MRANQFLLLGLTDGYVGVQCEKFHCDYQAILPPHSTMLDLERTTNKHVHPRKERA